MRNYFKVLAIKYRVHGEPGPINGDMFAWGANQEQLNYHILKANEQLTIVQPGTTWTFTYPTDPVPVYWMLNAKNFAKILNGGAAADNAQFFWNNTRLNLTSSEEIYFDQTQTEEQGSPRNTFPTDLGTDGQRLKENEAQSRGSALNYLAHLFVANLGVEDDSLFLDIIDNLSQRKITVKQALAAANSLVEDTL
jgi:hypothetical protein